MKKFNITFLTFTLILLYVSCSSSIVDPESVDYYMTLSVGDVRQYYDKELGMYNQWEITEKLKRSDGLDVFVGEWSNSLDTSSHISYYAIKDGFFISTELVYRGYTENPYSEQKLAQVYPKEGDTWSNSNSPPDSPKVHYLTKFIGNHSTLIGDFRDVYGVTLENFLIVYYAKYFGHIGTRFLPDTTFDVELNYIRIRGISRGKYKTFDYRETPKKLNKSLRRVNFLGQLIE